MTSALQKSDAISPGRTGQNDIISETSKSKIIHCVPFVMAMQRVGLMSREKRRIKLLKFK